MTLLHQERLAGVRGDLVDVAKRAAANLPFDVIVIEGVRSDQRQADLYAQGRTKPGKIVTWTLNSKHKKQSDGFGHAVDLAPMKGASIDWSDLKKFDAMALAIFRAAEQSGTHIRWGADWDGDGKPREKGESDSPHFEIA